jgi:GMP synthase-like glutamine amidotransferase
MKKRILVLDNSTRPGIYRPTVEWSRGFGGAPFDAVHVPSHAPIPPLDPYTHLLVTGSEASVCQPEDWFDTLADLIRDAVDRGLAVLGSCFGHQMLAWALSGSRYVRKAPTPELGWIAVDITQRDPLFAAVASPWHTFAAHQDEVVAPPAPWRVLATNAACAVQAMRYGDRPIWGIQPHPETSPEEARAMMRNALPKLPEYEREIRHALASPARDDHTAPKLAAAFLAAGDGDLATRALEDGVRRS